MIRLKSRWWLFKIRRQYRIGLSLFQRCEPGSPEQKRMGDRLLKLIDIIAEAENEYYNTGEIRGIRA